MNHLVYLDTRAGELEKILSGVKTMLVKEFDPPGIAMPLVNPGDSLYFLKNEDECALRVKASVVRVLSFTKYMDGDLSHTLKEMQPRLQLTEDQYNYWSAKQQVLLVEFNNAHKIDVMHVAPNKITDRSNWIAFKEFCEIIQQSISKNRM
jgi:hypothetical protein